MSRRKRRFPVLPAIVSILLVTMGGLATYQISQQYDFVLQTAQDKTAPTVQRDLPVPPPKTSTRG